MYMQEHECKCMRMLFWDIFASCDCATMVLKQHNETAAMAAVGLHGCAMQVQALLWGVVEHLLLLHM